MDNFISPKFEYKGFKPDGTTGDYFVFRRYFEGRLQTVFCTRDDLESGNIYKMIDKGYSRY